MTTSKILLSCFLGILFFGSCATTPAPLFKNLDFSNKCTNDASGLCQWDISYRAKSEIGPYLDERNNVNLMIDNENGVGYVEQTHIFNGPIAESIITFSAAIRTEDVAGKGAGLTIAVYDTSDKLIQNASMGYGNYSSVKGTTDWKSYDISSFIPKEAKSIRIGLINYGTGKAYFDNAKVHIEAIADRKPSPLSKEYIGSALDSIRKHSLRRDSVDFKEMETKAYRIAGDAKKTEDVHLAVRYLLKELGDHHSFFMTPKEYGLWSKPDITALEVAYSDCRIVEGFGYINIPGFHNDHEDLKRNFADTVRLQLKQLYDQNISGWIVDLRENDGGNMHPMLAGLEPLFSQDTLGGLRDIRGAIEYWGRGESFKESEPADYIIPRLAFSSTKQLPIAVLYDESTGSSGEIVIISFIGNAKTKSFGQPSFGLTTGNGMFLLPDGSYLFLASTRMMDRSGKVYSGKIVPNERTGIPTPENDSTLIAAIKWLKHMQSDQ